MSTTSDEVRRNLAGSIFAGRCGWCVAALVTASMFAAAPLQAIPVTVPTDLNPGDQYRLAFLTSATRDATSSNIADYNTFVSGVANAVPELAALGTTWKAIASTAKVAARDNTGTNPSSVGVPIYRLDEPVTSPKFGTVNRRIADNNADLWDGTLLLPLNILEDGTPQPINFSGVWTGTSSGGTASSPLGTSGVRIGRPHTKTFSWIFDQVSLVPAKPIEFYAISDVLTVVPEPGTVSILCIGMTGVVAHRRRSRRLG